MKLGAASAGFRTLFESGATGPLTDGQLLARFSGGPDEASSQAAFAALVARHGPMVWGTCRRILRDSHAAEDAFQATFLILVKKAGSIRVEDSLGRWLHGVVVRVSLRARAIEGRHGGMDVEGVEPQAPHHDPDLADLRSAIDEEVDRLPSAYRSVVVLCHLEGLTRERAADRLGCPVGTVNSRLSRAGELLKARLTRRGLAPESGGLVAWLAAKGAPAVVPPGLVGATLASSIRMIEGASLAGMVSARLAALMEGTLRRIGVMTALKSMALGTTLLALVGLATHAATQDPAKDEPSRSDPAPKAASRPDTTITPSLTERFQAIKAEWQAAVKRCWAEVAKGKTKAEQNELFARFHPNDVNYYQRCLDLAASAPTDPGARDARLWIIADGMRNSDSVGPRSVPIGQAVEGLLAHHPNDPIVARAALGVFNLPSQHRASLVRGLYRKAESHEVKGLAALALAQYLQTEASIVQLAHSTPSQPNSRYAGYDEAGKPVVEDTGYKDYDDAYWDRLKGDDEAAMRRESEDLFSLVAAEFADVPFNPWHSVGKDVVKNPNPKSLADFALAKLDDLHGLAVGKPAPEIAGVDLDGRPMKLSDYRGKVVAVVFWDSGCGPCLAAVPHERELVEKLKGRPFVMIGVNTDEKPEAARKAIDETKMAWPSWRDGPDGPIADRYHTVGFPTYVIDADGIIRHKNAHGLSLDTVVEESLARLAAKSGGAN